MKRLQKQAENIVNINELIKKIRLEEDYESITDLVDIDYNKENIKEDEVEQVVYCDFILNKQKIEKKYNITITDELWTELIDIIKQSIDPDIIIPEGIWLEIYDDNIMLYDEILNEKTMNTIKSSDNSFIKIEYYHERKDYNIPKWNEEEDEEY